MPYQPTRNPRRYLPLRCPTHSYTGPGWFMVTISTAHGRPTLGRIHDGRAIHTPLGRLVDRWWRSLEERTATARVDTMIVMPNHLHAVIQLKGKPSQLARAMPSRRFGPLMPGTLGAIMNHLKGGATRLARRQGLIGMGDALWHSRYHDRIIKSADHLAQARAYIRRNPARSAGGAAFKDLA